MIHRQLTLFRFTDNICIYRDNNKYMYTICMDNIRKSSLSKTMWFDNDASVR